MTLTKTDPGAESAMHRTLKELCAGEIATIHAVHLSAEGYVRLAGMGLCPGRKVEVVQTGERMIVRSGSTCLGLHEDLAAAVRVGG